MKPVWLLDIDGVLNYFPIKAPLDAGRDRATLPGYGVFNFTWDKALIGFIQDVIRDDEIEVRWATTWVSHIEEPERIFGFKAPLAFDKMSPYAKQQAAIDVVFQERRPLIWTDDDVVPDDLDHSGLRESLMGSGVPTLLIRPNPREGLRMKVDVPAIVDFTNASSRLG